MNDPASCPHARTQLIAKDSDAEYVECLDCGAILEAGECTEHGPSFDESLSDAQWRFGSDRHSSSDLSARAQDDTNRNFQRGMRLPDAEQADDARHIGRRDVVERALVFLLELLA